jgi:hypothetical protein
MATFLRIYFDAANFLRYGINNGNGKIKQAIELLNAELTIKVLFL